MWTEARHGIATLTAARPAPLEIRRSDTRAVARAGVPTNALDILRQMAAPNAHKRFLIAVRVATDDPVTR